MLRVTALFLLAAIALPARAENFALVQQGHLLDSSDTPVTQTALGFEFTLRQYLRSQPNEPEFWKASCAVDVREGFYSVVLGENCGTGLDDAKFPPGADRYLEVKLGSRALEPRLRIGLVPRAASANDALKLGGHVAGDFALRADLETAGTINTATNPVQWTKLAGVPAKLADPAALLTTVKAGAGLAGDGTAENALTFAPADASISWTKLKDIPATVGAVNVGAGLAGNGTSGDVLRFAPADGSIPWVKVSGFTVGAGLLGDGSSGGALRIKDDGITPTLLAANDAAIGKLSGGALTVANGRIGIGSSAPAVALDINATDAVKLPVGTTAQRPTNATTGMMRFNTTTRRVEFHDGTAWIGVGGLTASGGAVTEVNGYRIHTFNSSGTLSVTGYGLVEVLVVAGGGGGGFQVGGGGGAGGVVYNPSYLASGTISVTVGGGGAGAPATATPAVNGSNSVFGTITAIGGGAGANHDRNAGGFNGAGRAGGSGGGGAGDSGTTNGAGGAGTTGQGNSGGFGRASAWAGGGGGGAGAAGESSPSPEVGGKGGDGLPFSISGVETYYGGGGGGCNNNSSGTVAGGKGGGGKGTGNGNNNPSERNGAPNRGGGGGGVRDTSGSGGTGGSGVVIVRYPL